MVILIIQEKYGKIMVCWKTQFFHGENLANGIYNHLSRGLIFHCQVILLEGTCRRIGTIMNNPILYIFVSYLVIYICICILYIAEETLGG